MYIYYPNTSNVSLSRLTREVCRYNGRHDNQRVYAIVKQHEGRRKHLSVEIEMVEKEDSGDKKVCIRYELNVSVCRSNGRAISRVLSHILQIIP